MFCAKCSIFYAQPYSSKKYYKLIYIRQPHLNSDRLLPSQCMNICVVIPKKQGKHQELLTVIYISNKPHNFGQLSNPNAQFLNISREEHERWLLRVLEVRRVAFEASLCGRPYTAAGHIRFVMDALGRSEMKQINKEVCQSIKCACICQISYQKQSHAAPSFLCCFASGT